MGRWTLRDLVARATRRLLTAAARTDRPRRRSPLSLEKLEDRTLLAIVAPGETWSDATADRPATVFVQNYTESAPLEVSGGGGTASISPAPGVRAGKFVLSVTGDGVWSGDCGSITVWGSRHFGGTIEATGHAGINVGGDVGDVSAGAVWVQTSGSVGDLTAASTVSTNVAGSVRSVHSDGDVYRVLAGGSVGPVSAAGNVGRVRAGGDIKSVTAGGWVGWVQASGDIELGVTAAGDIGSAATFDPGEGSHAPGGPGGGVSAGRDLVGPVASGGHLGVVLVGRHARGTVTAPGNIERVMVGTGYVPPGADYDTYVPPPGDLSGAVSAGGHLGKVDATGDIIGALSAGGSVGRVRAGGEVSGGVRASGGDIASVDAGTDVLGPVWAAADIGNVHAAHDVTGTVTAGGEVHSAQAGGDLGGG